MSKSDTARDLITNLRIDAYHACKVLQEANTLHADFVTLLTDIEQNEPRMVYISAPGARAAPTSRQL